MNMYFDGGFSQFLQMDSFHKKMHTLIPDMKVFLALYAK